jgi:membrane-associated phospholipid phosphatase
MTGGHLAYSRGIDTQLPSERTSGQRTFAVVGGAAALAFVLLAVLVAARWGPLHRLDQRLAVDLNDYVAPHRGQTRAWQWISDVFSPGVLRGILLVAAAVLLLYRRVRAGLLCAGVSLGSLLVVSAGKAIVDRSRPHLAHPVAAAPGASYPSGHALTAAAAALTLVVLVWPRAAHRERVAAIVVAGLLAATVGFSRMVLGVHFLTDVVGGWLGAVAIVFLLLVPLSAERFRRD